MSANRQDERRAQFVCNVLNKVMGGSVGARKGGGGGGGGRRGGRGGSSHYRSEQGREQPCFECGLTGHVAKFCLYRGQAARRGITRARAQEMARDGNLWHAIHHFPVTRPELPAVGDELIVANLATLWVGGSVVPPPPSVAAGSQAGLTSQALLPAPAQGPNAARTAEWAAQTASAPAPPSAPSVVQSLGPPPTTVVGSASPSVSGQTPAASRQVPGDVARPNAGDNDDNDDNDGGEGTQRPNNAGTQGAENEDAGNAMVVGIHDGEARPPVVVPPHVASMASIVEAMSAHLSQDDKVSLVEEMMRRFNIN